MSAELLILAAALGVLAFIQGPARIRATPREVGAWSGYSAFVNPTKTIELCRGAGINHLDVMVQDGSTPGAAWSLYPEASIRTAVQLWQRAGLEVSLTTWVQPTDAWVAGVGQVARLARELGCGLTLDVETPWTLAVKPLPQHERDAWAERVMKSIEAAGIARRDVCATAIVSTDWTTAGPLLLRCGVLAPQAYATRTNAATMRIGADGVSGSLEALAVKRYREHHPAATIVLGLAADDGQDPERWTTEGAYGLSSIDAMRASLRAARGLKCGVRYWRLEFLRGERAALVRQAA